MDSLQSKALLAGLFFGLWPLLMNKSGLNGNISSIMFGVIVTLCLLPFSVGSWSGVAGTKWTIVIVAGILGAAGLFCFNGMLAKATPQDVGTLFVLMIVVQTAVPAIYQVIMNGGTVSLAKGLGFGLAAVASVLLVKS